MLDLIGIIDISANGMRKINLIQRENKIIFLNHALADYFKSKKYIL